MKEVSDILNTIKRATAFDIFLISFFALPFIFDAWVNVLAKLGWGKTKILWSLVVLFVLYIIGLTIMYFGNRAQKRRELAKDQIINYLQAKNFQMMSFNRVRQKINQSYSDNFLDQIIDSFPQDLRRAKLKGDKFGVARLLVEETDTDEA